jgi:hypothetical protein
MSPRGFAILATIIAERFVPSTIVDPHACDHMRAARTTTRPSPAFMSLPGSEEATQIAVLGEIVAHLAERVELLEAREQIGRAVLCAPRSRHRPRA